MATLDLRLTLSLGNEYICATLAEEPRGLVLAEGVGKRVSPATLSTKSQTHSRGLRTDSQLRTFGKLLADAALPASVSEQLAIRLRQGRVRIWLDVPDELRDIAWEYLWLNDLGGIHLAMHPL